MSRRYATPASATATPESIRGELTRMPIGENSCRTMGDTIVTRVTADAWQFGLEKESKSLDETVDRVMRSIQRDRGTRSYYADGRPVYWLQGIR